MFRPVFCIVCVLFLAVTIASAAPRDQAAIDRDANWAQEERDTAARLRDQEGSLANDSFRYGAFVTADLAQSKKAGEAAALLHEKIAAALIAGNEPEVQRLRKEATAAEKIKDLWHERISEWRKRQADAAPDEAWFNELIRWHREWLPELQAYSEARKAASEAWGRVAEAVVPGADKDALVALKEEAYTLDAEREIAEARFNWAYQREALWSDKKLNTEELRNTLVALQKAQEARLAFRRQEIERDRQARALDRAVHDADERFHKAYEHAQKEADEARNRPGRR